MSGATAAAKPESLRRTLALLVLDIGAPIGLYYGLHGAGVSTLVALGAGALVPAVGVIVQLITRRRLDGVGGVTSFRGAVVTSGDALGLAYTLASALGITIED